MAYKFEYGLQVRIEGAHCKSFCAARRTFMSFDGKMSAWCVLTVRCAAFAAIKPGKTLLPGLHQWPETRDGEVWAVSPTTKWLY
jgi:hypothetical protein